MNKRMFTFLLVFTLVFILGVGIAFAAYGTMNQPPMMDKQQVMMSADKVLKMAPDNGYYRFSVEDLKMKVDSGAMDFMIIDVRPMKLFKAEHMPGTTNIPLPTLLDNLNMLPMDKTIYVVCALDSNSSYATFTLRMLGYQAFMVPGGEGAWKQAGYPVVSDMGM